MDEIQTGDRKKKIVFQDTDKRQAELKIRLTYDNLGQTEFFKMILSYYLSQDYRIIEMIDEYKVKKGAREKQAREENKKLLKKAAVLKSKFSLDEGEIESIFDILQKEYPDL